ncbi:hypothetical protein F4811DRAFT_401169 [Daldinia bambusicola]|nr:hypothetical protein F4811DRAFT_401169 [Daldinia bambusicola]
MVYPSLEGDETASSSSITAARAGAATGSTADNTSRSGRSGNNGGTSNSSSNNNSKSRPSFTDYWKRTKEAARHITFVSSNPEQSAGTNKKNSANHQQQEPSDQSNSSSAQAKALARRQQVRKAQKQHRQRKVNYTRELEMDVARLRDLIEMTERESLALRGENEAIRRRLLGKTAPAPAQVPAPAPRPSLAPPALTYGTTTASLSLSLSSLPEYTVSLVSSAADLDKPMYQVQRTSRPSSWAHPAGAGLEDRGRGFLQQTETDQAINFILELERVCWGHFHPSMYDHEDYDPEATEHGHSLMVSAMALRSAPPEAWAHISAEKDRQASPSRPRPHPHPPHPHPHPHSSSHPNPSSSSASSFSFNAPLPSQSHPPHPSSHNTTTTSTSTTATITSWPTPPTPDLTLTNLHGLASVLNPSPPDSDPPELAPVQAWFEIARLYGGVAALLADAPRLARLRAELASAVECVHYGAVIRRADFEDVLARVLGQPVVGVAVSAEVPVGYGGGAGGEGWI